jgi:carboxylesterase type B
MVEVWCPKRLLRPLLRHCVGFATGNSANPIYDGQYFVENEDVVVVSIK